MAISDQQLLSAFIEHGDEQAFCELSKRYLGLVFQAAFRRTGDSSMSEDVSQNVLKLLVRKAPDLVEEPMRLPAWLHRAATLEAANLLRSKLRHERTKRALMDAQINEDSGFHDPVWEDALPHLDTALSKLRESDRSVLLMHYFQDMTFSEIGNVIGKSATAVQRQAHRCICRLAKKLRARGVRISGVALASLLCAESSKAAPTTLITQIPSIILTGDSVSQLPLLTKVSLLMTTKQKVTIAAMTVALAAAIPIVQQYQRAERLEARLAGMSNGGSLLTGSVIPTEDSVQTLPAEVYRNGTTLNAGQLGIFLNQFRMSKNEALIDIGMLAREDPKEAWKLLGTLSDNVSNYYDLSAIIWETWGAKEPDKALNAWLKQEMAPPRNTHPLHTRPRDKASAEALYRSLYKTDPVAAEKLLSSVDDKIPLLRSESVAFVEKNGIEASLLWQRDLPSTAQITENGSTSGEGLQSIIGWFEWAQESNINPEIVMETITESDWWGVEAVETFPLAARLMNTQPNPAQVIEKMAELPAGNVRKTAMTSAFSEWAVRDVDGALDYLAKTDLPEADLVSFLYGIASGTNSRKNVSVRNQARKILEEKGFSFPEVYVDGVRQE